MPEVIPTNDPTQIDDINLRSEEVQEILAAPPSWMLRWGITVIFGLIILVMFFAWLIRYPDLISGKAILTTAKSPVRLVAYTSGKLTLLSKKENTAVKKDELIASIESIVTPETLDTVAMFVKNVRSALKTPTSALPEFNSFVVLGEMQSEFNALTTAIKEYNITIADPYYQRRIAALDNQVAEYQKMLIANTKVYDITKKEFINAKTRYEANKKLYESGVISKLDYNEEENRYFQIEKQLAEIEKVLTQSKISIAEYQKQMNDIHFQQNEKIIQYVYRIYEKLNVLDNFNELWQQKFLIKSPIDGNLSFLTTLNENLFVTQNQPLFSVVPNDQEYIAITYVQNLNFGKIRIDQDVNLKFDNYNYSEFGFLTGKVKAISLIPTENTYRVEIALTNGLTSTYHKQFEYRPEMSATAEIVTEDLSLLERILHQFRELLKSKKV